MRVEGETVMVFSSHGNGELCQILVRKMSGATASTWFRVQG